MQLELTTKLFHWNFSTFSMKQQSPHSLQVSRAQSNEPTGPNATSTGETEQEKTPPGLELQLRIQLNWKARKDPTGACALTIARRCNGKRNDPTGAIQLKSNETANWVRLHETTDMPSTEREPRCHMPDTYSPHDGKDSLSYKLYAHARTQIRGRQRRASSHVRIVGSRYIRLSKRMLGVEGLTKLLS